MKVSFHKKFDKQFSKLSKKDQLIVLDTIKLFKKNPNEPKLKNHALKGKLKTQNAIHARFDLCLVYLEIESGYEILFLRVGSHEEVY